MVTRSIMFLLNHNIFHTRDSCSNNHRPITSVPLWLIRSKIEFPGHWGSIVSWSKWKCHQIPAQHNCITPHGRTWIPLENWAHLSHTIIALSLTFQRTWLFQFMALKSGIFAVCLRVIHRRPQTERCVDVPGTCWRVSPLVGFSWCLGIWNTRCHSVRIRPWDNPCRNAGTPLTIQISQTYAFIFLLRWVNWDWRS